MDFVLFNNNILMFTIYIHGILCTKINPVIEFIILIFMGHDPSLIMKTNVVVEILIVDKFIEF